MFKLNIIGNPPPTQVPTGLPLGLENIEASDSDGAFDNTDYIDIAAGGASSFEFQAETQSPQAIIASQVLKSIRNGSEAHEALALMPKSGATPDENVTATIERFIRDTEVEDAKTHARAEEIIEWMKAFSQSIDPIAVGYKGTTWWSRFIGRKIDPGDVLREILRTIDIEGQNGDDAKTFIRRYTDSLIARRETLRELKGSIEERAFQNAAVTELLSRINRGIREMQDDPLNADDNRRLQDAHEEVIACQLDHGESATRITQSASRTQQLMRKISQVIDSNNRTIATFEAIMPIFQQLVARLHNLNENDKLLPATSAFLTIAVRSKGNLKEEEALRSMSPAHPIIHYIQNLIGAAQRLQDATNIFAQSHEAMSRASQENLPKLSRMMTMPHKTSIRLADTHPTNAIGTSNRATLPAPKKRT